MPEGDTIHKAAAKLRPALEGATLVRFEAARLAGTMPRPGTTITAVEAQGKYLLVRFADGYMLQTHMKMTGRWDLYRTGERWWKPAHLARAVIEVDGWVAVCFSAPVVRIIRVKPDDAPADGLDLAPDAKDGVGAASSPEGPAASAWGWIDATAPDAASLAATVDEPAPEAEPVADGLTLHRDQRFASLDHLGPDLCRADADLDLAVARMATVASPDDDIADVLLDQRVAAGIGNVYTSEVLWACRLHPLTPLADVGTDLRRQLLETAASQLRANLTTRRRTTVAGPPGSLAVYHRSRRPCRRCGTAIRWQRTGRDHRSTYWCPRCQPAPAARD
jgi:formamidopyrimidine-DNA glycosylase